MTVTADHRQRLDAIRERVSTARSRRQTARQLLDAAREAGDVDAQAVAQVQLDEAYTELETSEALQSQMLAALAGVDASPVATGIFDNPDVTEKLRRMGSGSYPVGAVDLGPLQSVEQLVATIDAGSWGPSKMAAAGPVSVPDAARVGPFYGVVPQLRRPLSILDLLPVASMSSRSFTYLQEAGGYYAAEVADHAMKPESGVDLNEAEVIAATIAVWQKVSRPQISDVPALQRIINERLMYSVMRRLEDQVIAGDGTGENITGILSMNIGAVEFDGGDSPLTDLALDGIVETLVNDATPDAVVLHPADWAEMLKASDATGQRVDSAGAFSTPPVQLWGLPAIRSTAVPLGSALVGAFGTGGQLFVREPLSLRITDSDQSDFVQNRLTILAEGRFGLAVFQPSAFCHVQLTGAS